MDGKRWHLDPEGQRRAISIVFAQGEAGGHCQASECWAWPPWDGARVRPSHSIAVCRKKKKKGLIAFCNTTQAHEQEFNHVKLGRTIGCKFWLVLGNERKTILTRPYCLVSGLVYLVEVQLHLICVHHESLFVATIKTAANTLEKWGRKARCWSQPPPSGRRWWTCPCPRLAVRRFQGTYYSGDKGKQLACPIDVLYIYICPWRNSKHYLPA